MPSKKAPPTPEAPAPLGLNSVVVATCALVKPILEDKGICLAFDLCDALPPVGSRPWAKARQPGGVFHFEVPYAP